MSEKIDNLKGVINVGAYDDLSQDEVKKLIAEDFMKIYGGLDSSRLNDVIKAIDETNFKYGNPFLDIVGDYGRASYSTGGTEYGKVPEKYHHQGIHERSISEKNQKWNEEHGYPTDADYYEISMPKLTPEEYKRGVRTLQDTMRLFKEGFLHGPITPGYEYVKDPDTGEYYAVTKQEGSLFDDWLAEMVHAMQYGGKSGFVRDSVGKESDRQRKFYGTHSHGAGDETQYDIQEQDKLLKDFPDIPRGDDVEGLRQLFKDAIGEPTIESAHDRDEGIVFNEILELLGETPTTIKEGSYEDILDRLAKGEIGEPESVLGSKFGDYAGKALLGVSPLFGAASLLKGLLK